MTLPMGRPEPQNPPAPEGAPPTDRRSAGGDGGLLVLLARFAVRRRWAVIAAALLLAGAAVAFAARHLELRTSNLDLMDPELPEVARFRAFAEEFGTPNVLVVVVEGEEPAQVHAVVDALAPRLRRVAGVRAVIASLPVDRAALQRLGLTPWFGSDDGRLAVAFVQPEDTESRADALAPVVAGVRRLLAEAPELATAGSLRAGVTGLPAYALDDRDVIQHDVSRLSGLAFGLVLLLFVTAFRAFARPALAMASLLVAVAVTVGVAALHPGHLTLLSAFFGSILFGLGVDFGIHLVGRVEELTATGLTEAEAVPRAVAGVGRGLVTGGLTTAGAFFALTLSGFRGFAELGWIAGAGVLLCLVATLTVLPALLAVAARPRRRRTPAARRRLGRLLLALQHRPLALGLLVAGLALPFFARPGFDADYLALQPRGSETVRLEREMVERTSLSPQFAAFTTPDAASAAELARRLRKDPAVGTVRSAADLAPLSLLPISDPAALAALRAGFVAPSGRHAVYAYPEGDVWEPAQRDRFLAHVRAVDPEVTGMPVLGAFMIGRSREALVRGAWMGSLVVVLCVLADFRRWRPALLALVPTYGGVAAMLGLMGLLGVDFNPLNVMALPVVLGIAVDDGVHVVHRWIEEGGDGRRTLAGTGRSVLLTSLTSLAAFGSLLFTSHRGLASFAQVLSLGITASLLLSLLTLPTLLARLLPQPGAR